MPIHLRPLSRRQFLQRAGTVAAALALAPELVAARRRTNEDFWALFSDIHLSSDRTKVARNINMAEHFAQVSRELLGLANRPAGLFITGDCAFNSGETGDYAVVKEVLEPIRNDQVPVHIGLGNHDNRERFWEALQEEKAARRPLAERQVAIIKGRRANWFLLDSLEKTLSTPGLLGEVQLKWLADTLDANRSKPALVLVHHNPGAAQNISGLKDTEALLAVIRPRRQVKALIYGHTHHWNVGQDSSGLHLVNLPPVAYIFQEGDPAGWVHATLQNKGMQLELRCIDVAHKEHGRKLDLAWR